MKSIFLPFLFLLLSACNPIGENESLVDNSHNPGLSEIQAGNEKPVLSFEDAKGKSGLIGVAMKITPSRLTGEKIITCQVKSGTTPLPSWASIDPETCEISGIPSVGLSTKTYSIVASNSAGESEVASVQLTVKAVLPTSIVLQSPSTSPANDITPSITISGGDVAKDATISLFSDSTCSTQIATATASGSSVTLTTNAFSEGTHAIHVKLTSGDYETDCSVDSLSYTVDLTAPIVSAVSVQSGLTVDVTFDGAIASGALSASNYSVSGAGAGTLTSNPDSVSLVSGNTYRLAWTTGEMKDSGTIVVAVSNAQDNLGNTVSSSGSHANGGIGFAPSVTGIANDSSPTQSKSWSWGCSESSCTYRYAIDTSSTWTASGSYSSTTAAIQSTVTGTYYLHVQAQDAAGNLSSVATVSAVIDNANPAAPAIALTTPSSSPGNTTRPIFTLSLEGGGNFSSTDTVQIFNQSACAGTSVSFNTNQNTGFGSTTISAYLDNALTNGTSTTFSVKVTDAAGNSICSSSHSTIGSRSAIYTLDTTLPTVTSVAVQTALTIDVAFSESMSTGVTTASNYSASGTGKGTLNTNPDSVALVSGNIYRLTWNSGEMKNGGNITISVATAQDSAGNTVSSNATHTGGAIGTAPAVPAIAFNSPGSSPNTDSTPTFSVTLTGGGSFLSTDTIALYNDTGCGGSEVDSTSGNTGTTATVTSTAQSETIVNYSVKVTDAAGNSSCSDSHATATSQYKAYLYDATDPTWANSISNASTSSSITASPTISVTLNASDGVNGSGVSSYQYAIGTGNSGSNQNNIVNWANFSSTSFTESGLSLSYGTTYYVNMRAVDAVGHYSTVISSSWTVDSISLSVAAKYTNATKWMDYIKTSDYSTLCAGTESARSDCIHGAEYKKVTVSNLSDCTGLSMSDYRGLFDWTCSDLGSTIEFNGVFKSTKRLKDLIDFSTPAILSNYVTLSGCPGCTFNSSSSVWYSNSVTSLPANDGTSTLTLDGTDSDGSGPDAVFTSGTIFVLASDANASGYKLGLSKMAMVTNTSATLKWNGDTNTNSNCGSKRTLVNISNYFNWIEGNFSGNSTSNPAEVGICIYSYHFTRLETIDTLDFTYQHIGQWNGSGKGYLHNLTVRNVNRSTSHAAIIDSNSVSTVDNKYENITLTGTGSNIAAYGLYMQFWTTSATVSGTLNFDTATWCINGNNPAGTTFSADITARNCSLGFSGSSTTTYSGTVKVYNGVLNFAGTKVNYKGTYSVVNNSYTDYVPVGIAGTGTKIANLKLESATTTHGDGNQIAVTGSYNTVQNLVIIGGTKPNRLWGTHSKNVFDRVTAVNSSNYFLGQWSGTYSNDIFKSVFTANTSTAFAFGTNTSLSLIDLFLTSGGGISLPTGSTNAGVSGVLAVGNNTSNCTVSGTAYGLINSTCTNTGVDGSSSYTTNSNISNAVLRTNRSASGTIVGKLTSDDTSNTSDSNGVASFSSTLDWFSFENFYRGWGKYSANSFPNSDQKGVCTTGGTCQIWDVSLSRSDTQNLNRSGNGSNINNGSSLATDGSPAEILSDGVGNDDGVCETNELCYNTFSSTGACPVQVAGSRFSYTPVYTYDSSWTGGLNGIQVVETSGDGIGNDDGTCDDNEICVEGGDSVCNASSEKCVQRFLTNASEILFDGIGDDDGLCETNEDCIYNPNIGAYQGHGNIVGPCTFSSGTISGVNMYGYEYNGR